MTEPDGCDDRPLLDADAAAVRLGTTVRHVKRLASERRIATVRVGRKLRFDPDDLDAYVDSARTEVGP